MELNIRSAKEHQKQTKVETMCSLLVSFHFCSHFILTLSLSADHFPSPYDRELVAGEIYMLQVQIQALASPSSQNISEERNVPTWRLMCPQLTVL